MSGFGNVSREPLPFCPRPSSNPVEKVGSGRSSGSRCTYAASVNAGEWWPSHAWTCSAFRPERKSVVAHVWRPDLRTASRSDRCARASPRIAAGREDQLAFAHLRDQPRRRVQPPRVGVNDSPPPAATSSSNRSSAKSDVSSRRTRRERYTWRSATPADPTVGHRRKLVV